MATLRAFLICTATILTGTTLSLMERDAGAQGGGENGFANCRTCTTCPGNNQQCTGCTGCGCLAGDCDSN